MMNLYLSAAEYDYHTLLKVAEMAGLAGIIGFHEAGDGYLVTFPQGENVQYNFSGAGAQLFGASKPATLQVNDANPKLFRFKNFWGTGMKYARSL